MDMIIRIDFWEKALAGLEEQSLKSGRGLEQQHRW